MTVLRLIHSILAAVAVVLLTMVFGLACTTASALGSSRHALRLARAWGRSCLIVSGVRLRVEGRDHLEPRERYVIMVNHESAFDIPALVAGLPASLNIRFLAKRSLFRLPFLGWSMRGMGFVPVDRDDRSRAGEALARAGELVRKGASLLLFPEETRSSAEELLPFRRGGFLMALTSGLPILPVGLDGTREVLAPGGRLLRPGEVTVRIGRPVATEGLRIKDRPALMAEIRNAIEELREGRAAPVARHH